jgi:hypothetical protein
VDELVTSEQIARDWKKYFEKNWIETHPDNPSGVFESDIWREWIKNYGR